MDVAGGFLLRCPSNVVSLMLCARRFQLQCWRRRRGQSFDPARGARHWTLASSLINIQSIGLCLRDDAHEYPRPRPPPEPPPEPPPDTSPPPWFDPSTVVSFATCSHHRPQLQCWWRRRKRFCNPARGARHWTMASSVINIYATGLCLHDDAHGYP